MAGGYTIEVYNKTGTYLGSAGYDADVSVSEVLTNSIFTNNGITAISLTQGGTTLSNNYIFNFGLQDSYNVYDVTPEPTYSIVKMYHNGVEYETGGGLGTEFISNDEYLGITPVEDKPYIIKQDGDDELSFTILAGAELLEVQPTLSDTLYGTGTGRSEYAASVTGQIVVEVKADKVVMYDSDVTAYSARECNGNIYSFETSQFTLRSSRMALKLISKTGTVKYLCFEIESSD